MARPKKYLTEEEQHQARIEKVRRFRAKQKSPEIPIVQTIKEVKNPETSENPKPMILGKPKGLDMNLLRQKIAEEITKEKEADRLPPPPTVTFIAKPPG